MKEEIWIKKEFKKWCRKPCYVPYGIDREGNWIAKSFALYILRKILRNSQKKQKTQRHVKSGGKKEYLTNPLFD